MTPRRFFSVLLPLSLISIVASIGAGSVHLDWSRLLAGDYAGSDYQILMQIRVPRVLAAFVVGALLAVSGALMQVLVRNSLADPYILGVSGGAASFALLAMLLGLATLLVSLAAFVGALVSILLVFFLANSKGSWTPVRLLLTGVVLAAGWGAVITLLLSIAPDGNLRSMLFWLMGDLSLATLPLIPFVILIIGVAIVISYARDLNVLVNGDLAATSLGVNVKKMQLVLYLVATFFTAIAVTTAGSIGFIGLIVPHMIRLLIGSDHRLLLPASVFLGGTLLVVADTLARTIVAPQQLPVGVVTAFLGVPFFLLLLNRGYKPHA